VIHNAGIVCAVHGAHSAGACAVLATPDLDTALPLLAAEGVTDVLLGPGHYGAVDHPAFPRLVGSLRRVVLSGKKVPPALFDRLERDGVWSGQLFGMGEGLLMATRPGSPRAARATTVGTPISELDEVAVLEPGGLGPVPDGEVGELVCRGPYTLHGYFDAAEHNATAFTPDGYYRTGDLAAVRFFEGGRYYSIEGRIKDLINRGGEKINAEEVEQLLRRHPAVTDAAAVAMPDERLGERTCVFVVTGDAPLALDDVRRHFAALQVAKFKWPERVEVVPALPRTQIGKIDKKALRAELLGRLAAETGMADATDR
jgi:non-ribosomal peptide synthetase component E (peptide arylation enzyme)